MRFIASCKLGLESTVTRQLRDLNIEVEQTQDARVFFRGGFEELSRALLWLRTAERVFLEVGSFKAHSFDELFEGVKALPWSRYLKPTSRIHVNGKSAKSTLFSVSDCQSITKKAIIEGLKSQCRVSVIPETGAEIIVEVGMLRDEASLTLDCCGAGLSRRGYRTYNVAAPIAETLGAGLVMLSRFSKGTPLVDPMCGSGTIPIEAAMIAQNRAPSLNREFACEKWFFFDKAALERERRNAMDAIDPAPVMISGYDIDPRCIELCKLHAKKAGVNLRWKAQPVKALSCPEPHGVIICNPPYGERLLNRKQAEELYCEMRLVFTGLSDWQINIINSQPDFERSYGRRADRRRKLTNGGLPCTLYQYYPPRNEY